MALDELDALYRDAILDHARSPRNPEPIQGAHIVADGVNPFCGDEIHLQIRLGGDGRVAEVGFQGKGCSINQAAGSMLGEAIKGKTIEHIEDVAEQFKRMMDGKLSAEEALRHLGSLESLSAVRQFPVRIKCALLAWRTLEEGISDYFCKRC